MENRSTWCTTGLLSLTLAALLSGCSKSEQPASPATDITTKPTDASSSPPAPLQNLLIDDFGPKKTKAGESFNAQPNGNSAIWVRANQPLDGYDAAIWFNGHRLGDRGINKSTVTGTLPPDFFSTPGSYSVEIRLGADGTQLSSNKVEFVVE